MTFELTVELMMVNAEQTVANREQIAIFKAQNLKTYNDRVAKRKKAHTKSDEDAEIY